MEDGLPGEHTIIQELDEYRCWRGTGGTPHSSAPLSAHRQMAGSSYFPFLFQKRQRQADRLPCAPNETPGRDFDGDLHPSTFKLREPLLSLRGSSAVWEGQKVAVRARESLVGPCRHLLRSLLRTPSVAHAADPLLLRGRTRTFVPSWSTALGLRPPVVAGVDFEL